MDAIVPQGNRKQRLSIFAKKMDVLFGVTVGNMGKLRLSLPTAPSCIGSQWLWSGFFYHYSKKLLSLTNSLFKMPLKTYNEVSENRFT